MEHGNHAQMNHEGQDFPTDHIESQLCIIAAVDPSFLIELTTGLIVGISVGIVVVVVGYYKRDLIRKTYSENN